jgi:hypothetical protein
MAAKTHDIDLSHSGRENSEKPRREQGGVGLSPFSVTDLRLLPIISKDIKKNISSDQLFSPGVTGILWQLWEELGVLRWIREGRRPRMYKAPALNLLRSTGGHCYESAGEVFQ